MNRTFFLLIHRHIFKMGPQREKEMKLLMRHGLSPWYIKSNQDAKRAVNELSAYLFFFFPPHIRYMKSLTLCPACCQVELCSIFLFPCTVLEITIKSVLKCILEYCCYIAKMTHLPLTSICLHSHKFTVYEQKHWATPPNLWIQLYKNKATSHAVYLYKQL